MVRLVKIRSANGSCMKKGDQFRACSTPRPNKRRKKTDTDLTHPTTHIVKEALKPGLRLTDSPDPEVIPAGSDQVREKSFLCRQKAEERGD